jgi:Protein of unknown function (DUF3224)
MERKTLTSKRQQVIFSICVIWGFGGVVHAQSQPQTPGAAQQSSPGKGTTMTKHARGTFDVKVTPQKPDNKEAETANLERLSIDKEFHGDLEGTSTGEMLASRGEVKGSGGYVAMERVKATLAGRKGTFVLQHSGTMTHNTPQMSVTVVPDSGTGALAGIAGSMTIKIEEGKHFYDFEYTLQEQH